MDSGSGLPARITFGRFCLMPDRREILLEDQPIRLGSRAFDVLMALIEARGSVVSKDELLARVWPNQIVEENNLEVQVSTLRAVFGAERGLIRTVSRRGYQFTGEISFPPATTDAQLRAGAGAVPPTNLPQPFSDLIGRDSDLLEILRLAASHRLVTLTGTGGIGKTRLAFAAGHRMLPQFGDGAWLVELAPLSDPGLVPAAVAAAIGLEFADGSVTSERVANALGGKELLLVVDNCEHLIDAAARMAEALLRASPTARVIVTSREPLRAEGEQIYPVPPLAVPAANFDDKTDPLEYGAVRLFVERARAAEPRFMPDERLMALLAMICRRVDGIPLAIELAAARAAALSIEEIAVRLDDRFNLLTGGRRTALPRHQTLQATLDWSHGLLVEPERVLFRRLAIFAGSFSLGAACEIAASPELRASDVIDGISSLAAKSLVAAVVDGAFARYRLLDTTRAYALEKLGESGEHQRIAQRHAAYYRDLFVRAESDWKARPTAEWLGEYGWRIDNLRAALDWTFSAGGDATLGVELTATAVPLWMLLSLVDECRGRVERALAALDAETNRHPRREMQLHAAMGEALTYTGGATPEYEAAWRKALEMAERVDDAEYQLRSLWGLWSFYLTRGRHRIALEMAQRFQTLAAHRPDPEDRLFGERMIGVAQHHLGDQLSARHHLEEVSIHHGPTSHKPDVIPFQTDFRRFQTNFRISARAFLARVLWFQGFSDQAVHTAEMTVAEAAATGDALALYLALGMAACPIALLVGDLVAAEHYVGMLIEHSTRHALPHWRAYGRCYQGALVMRRGDIRAGAGLLRAGFAELGEAESAVLRLVKLLAAETLGHAGEIADGLTAIEEAVEHSERLDERWLTADLLRVKGELLLLQGGTGSAAAAEDHFRQALDWGLRQGALSWELRAAISLAGLLRDQGRSADAKTLLEPVYDRFTEGFDTADLKTAKLLLDQLR